MSQIFSHSRLSNFENCPLKFKYRYVLKIETDVEGIEGFMGKRAHEVAHANDCRAGVASLVLKLDELREARG